MNLDIMSIHHNDPDNIIDDPEDIDNNAADS